MRHTYFQPEKRKRVVTRLASASLALLLSASLFTCSKLSPSAQAVTQEEINAMKGQQAELQSKIGDLQNQIQDLQTQKNSAVDQCLLYQQQADALAEQVENTNRMIAEYQAQIEETQANLAAAEAEEATHYQLFCTRVRSMEEGGTISYWQILFSSQSFSDLLDNINLISEIMSYDNQVMDELEQVRQTVAETKAQLEAEETELEQALTDLETQKAEADTAYQAADAALQVIQQNEAVYADQISSLEQQNEELEADIVSSEAEYAAQIAALEAAAAAEAQRQAEAEEAQRQQAEQQQQTTTPTQETPQETAPSDSAPAEEETTPSAPSSNSSGLGAQIAAYACQFIGNPYVWGGTSLTNGCDCSGFVMSVYKHFGYSLPRTSYGQETCGRAVSYADAQPGDIVCYTGHVGIYIGDGMMVNALNSRSGIVISSVNIIRSGFTIRRVV